MKEANRVTEGALFIAVYIVLLLIVLFVPFLFFFGLFILPIPFIMYARRYDYRAAFLVFFAALVLTMMFATAVSLPITLMAGIGGIVLGTSLYRERTAYEAWARGSVGFIVAMLLILVIMQGLFQINIYSETEMLIEESIQMAQSMMASLNISEEQASSLALIEEQMRTFPDLLPASIAISSIFLAFFSLWLSFKVMNRVERTRYAFPPFRQFSLPKSVLWIYFIVILFSFFIGDEDELLYVAILNITMLLITLVTIQGFSFIFCYAHAKKWNRMIPIMILLVSLLIPFISMLIVRIIGIIDLGFDLKEKVQQAERG